MDDDAPDGPGRGDEITVLGALAEPNRRALYDYVAGSRDWVGREQAADAVGLRRGIAAHHLDRLADDGLLEIDYKRLTERTGPGAGRPAKVYRRAHGELGVSLPPRHYELAGQLLAEGADRARRDGTPVTIAINAAAHDRGEQIGGEVQQRLDRRSGTGARRAALLDELRRRGFEPETCCDGVTVLHNCPFHQLSRQHTELICGMNLSLLQALLGGLDGLDLRARLEPETGHCCVRLHPAE
jgi:predicted ArsR family transcriptional regulator